MIRQFRNAHIERLSFCRSKESDVCLAVPVMDNGPGRLFFAEKERIGRYSRYFSAMFGRSWREASLSTDGKPVWIEGVSAEIFHSLLHFLYTQHLIVPKLSLPPIAIFWLLQQYSAYFQILEEAACAYVSSTLTPTTIVHSWREAVENGSKKLAKACVRYFVLHFEECTRTLSFLTAPTELMSAVLRSGEIDCDSDVMFAALQLWGRVIISREQLKESLESFLTPYLPPNVLFNVDHKRALMHGTRDRFY